MLAGIYIGFGVGMREADVDFALAAMRLKQTKHEIATESSDAKQRRLNDVVNRGLQRKQKGCDVGPGVSVVCSLSLRASPLHVTFF